MSLDPQEVIVVSDLDGNDDSVESNFRAETAIMDYDDSLLTSPLIEAIKIADNKMAELYIKNGRYVTDPDIQCRTPLHWAVESECLEIIGWLLESPDIDKNATDFLGNSPLHLAMPKSFPIAKCLIQFQCDISARNRFDQTPLHLSIRYSSTLIAEELLKRGADIDCIDHVCFTPLHYAVKNNDLEAVCMLLCYGADVTMQCDEGVTPFMYAVSQVDCLEIAKTLFKYYDDFTATDIFDYNAILSAASIESPLAVDIVRTADSINWIPLGSENRLVLFALNYSTAELFREVWHKLNLKDVSCADVFIGLVTMCSFPTSEWLQCLYDLLDSSAELNLNELAYSKLEYVNVLFKKIYYIQNVALNDVIRITVFFLTYGFRVCLCYLNIIYTFYGCREEFEIVLNCLSIKRCRCKCNSELFPLISFILGQDDGTDLNNIVSLLCFLLKESSMMLTTTLRENNILNALEYFSFPCHVRDVLIQSAIGPSLKEKIKNKLTIIPEIPTLMELTRNEIRDSVKKNCISPPHSFYQSVRKLKLPQKLIDIICFKESLYK